MQEDFLDLYEKIEKHDYDTLLNATDTNGKAYKKVFLPMTDKNVGDLGYKGNYLNYYVANEVVLVPIYHDRNDNVALHKIAAIYKDKKIIGIDVRKLYPYGGMLHCITQQQIHKD